MKIWFRRRIEERKDLGGETNKSVVKSNDNTIQKQNQHEVLKTESKSYLDESFLLFHKTTSHLVRLGLYQSHFTLINNYEIVSEDRKVLAQKRHGYTDKTTINSRV